MSIPSTWSAGAASVRFTPQEDLWLAGYAARKAPSRGVHSDLYASAVALRDARGETVVFVSADIIAIPAKLADQAAQAVRERFPEVSRENFVFAATHTHFAPEIRPDKVLFFKIPPEFAAKIEPTASKVAAAMAEAAIGALANMDPVSVFARRGIAAFAHNRRGGEVTDHEVPVLEVRRGDGTVKAVLFGYACHNTTIDPQDRRYSSDWAGRAIRRIEELHPGCVAAFITGCGADQNPHPRGTPELSDQYGLELAEAVEKALRTQGPEVTPLLKIARGEAELDMVPVTEASLEEAIASGDPPRQVKAQHLKDRLARGDVLEKSYPAIMQVVKLGDQVLLVLMSGETVIDWSHKFKAEFAAVAPLVWVAGYCNDMFGYVPTLRVQREGGYEGGRANLWSWVPSPWTESVEEQVTETIRSLVRKVN